MSIACRFAVRDSCCTVAMLCALLPVVGCAEATRSQGTVGGAAGQVSSAQTGGFVNSSGGSPSGGTSSMSGGTSSSGTGGVGNATGGASTGGAGGRVEPPPTVVHACDQLAPQGQWEDATPPELKRNTWCNPQDSTCNGPGKTPTYGVASVAVDPVNSGTVYLGTSSMGIWKTTDCGSTWVHINTGPTSENCGSSGKSCAALLDTGRNWTFEVDRINPEVLYTNSGYGSEDDGLFKSTNGGVDWVGVWPSRDPVVNSAATSFVMRVRPDLDDHLHLLLSFHEMCGDFKNGDGCLTESTDGGSTWRVVHGTPPFGYEASGFILSSTTWITTSNDQLWRTSDSGATWTSVANISAGGHVPGQLYRADNGVYYIGGGAGVARSTDGIHWTTAPNTGSNVMGVIGSGTNLYASGSALCYELGTDVKPYRTSPESDGLTWTTMPSPPMTQGGNLAYDRGHHLLYASNCRQGFWRVVTP